jgi:hypothetical protein
MTWLRLSASINLHLLRRRGVLFLALRKRGSKRSSVVVGHLRCRHGIAFLPLKIAYGLTPMVWPTRFVSSVPLDRTRVGHTALPTRNSVAPDWPYRCDPQDLFGTLSFSLFFLFMYILILYYLEWVVVFATRLGRDIKYVWRGPSHVLIWLALEWPLVIMKGLNEGPMSMKFESWLFEFLYSFIISIFMFQSWFRRGKVRF